MLATRFGYTETGVGIVEFVPNIVKDRGGAFHTNNHLGERIEGHVLTAHGPAVTHMLSRVGTRSSIPASLAQDVIKPRNEPYSSFSIMPGVFVNLDAEQPENWPPLKPKRHIPLLPQQAVIFEVPILTEQVIQPQAVLLH